MNLNKAQRYLLVRLVPVLVVVALVALYVVIQVLEP